MALDTPTRVAMTSRRLNLFASALLEAGTRASLALLIGTLVIET
jgi:hypothetical protein